MDYKEAIKWANSQGVVQVRAVREDEQDKFTFTVGEYIVSPLMFDTQEQAESFLKLKDDDAEDVEDDENEIDIKEKEEEKDEINE